MSQKYESCAILPPFVLAQVAESGSPSQREAALNTIAISASVRARRAVVGSLMRTMGLSAGELTTASSAAKEKVTVYDAHHGGDATLPGVLKRQTGGPVAGDTAVNEAFDGADETYRFYHDIFSRNSVDNSGLELISSVHYRANLDNAFWNGSQMLYGDGSGQILKVGSLTKSLDVIGHELTHGVTQYTAGLEYHEQPGALNESISDVFGSLVKQRKLNQTADKADWLIGTGILGPALNGVALRSMKDPGTAFSGDPQPATMAKYVVLPADADPRHDNGGVHINSGIPNRAFYLTAVAIGGNAWGDAGKIWYRALTTKITATSSFAQAARATVASARELFGNRSSQVTAVRDAWQQVGVLKPRRAHP
ncbi:MAG TPA: M4 family metallopeptidase [Candidatus Limnocylindrales bacterium]|jgi:Zn-dependent metalloprotease